MIDGLGYVDYVQMCACMYSSISSNFQLILGVPIFSAMLLAYYHAKQPKRGREFIAKSFEEITETVCSVRIFPHMYPAHVNVRLI